MRQKMQLHIPLFAVALLSISCFSVSLRAADDPTISPEQMVLDRFLGTWQTEYRLPKGEWTPVEKTGSADLIYRRVLGGQFIQEDGTHMDESTALRMLTYDAQRAEYRTWFFSSRGQANEAKGQWDAKSMTLTWTDVAAAPNGITSRARHHFLNDNEFEWDVEVRDKAGKIVFQMEGKAKRSTK